MQWVLGLGIDGAGCALLSFQVQHSKCSSLVLPLTFRALLPRDGNISCLRNSHRPSFNPAVAIKGLDFASQNFQEPVKLPKHRCSQRNSQGSMIFSLHAHIPSRNLKLSMPPNLPVGPGMPEKESEGLPRRTGGQSAGTSSVGQRVLELSGLAELLQSKLQDEVENN